MEYDPSPFPNVQQFYHDRIAEHLEKGMDRIPQFKDVGIKRIICGPITHTPDDNFLAGPAPGLKNFWMFCAASIGIAHEQFQYLLHKTSKSF